MIKITSVINVNAPVVLGFTALTTIALVLGLISDGWTNYAIFSVRFTSWTDPMTYIRMFSHVFGHGSLEHFVGNMTLFLIIGPLLEEKYGSENFALFILATAFITGLIHLIFFKNVMLLGASGVVFSFILASSLTGMEDGKIPLTFVLVAVFYLGQECFNAIFVNDNVSQLSHIIGGVVGAFLAVILNINRN